VPHHRVQIPCISLQQQVMCFRACKMDASNYGDPLYLLWAFELHFFLSFFVGKTLSFFIEDRNCNR
jgi:hypothetical protein